MSKTDYDGDLFVIVNTSRGVDVFPAPEMHYVLPGEEPKTFGTLDEAAEALLDLADEYGHTVETAPIFRLEPVPANEVEAAVERARARLADDLEVDIGAIRYQMEAQPDTTPGGLDLDSPVALQVDGWGDSFECPKCGGTLEATVIERYYGCMLSYAPDGAYLDGQANIDTWENDDAENDLVAITCGECDFRIDDFGLAQIEVVPLPNT